MSRMHIVGALAASTLLTGATAAVAASAGDVAPDRQPLAVQSQEHGAPLVKVANVAGSFAFLQDGTTSNGHIREVFQKASASLCNVLPAYASPAADRWTLDIAGDVGRPFSGTMQELAEEAGEATFVLACSCTANPVGGAAIAQAEIRGVPLSGIARAAGL